MDANKDIENKIVGLAKVAKPRIPIGISRTRLIGMLDGAFSRPVVWIEAPPGSGKTVLADSYIEEKKLKTIWYQIDGRDKDIGSFFHFMSLAVESVSGVRRKPMPVLSPEYIPGLETFARNYFEELCSRFKGHLLITLDNYHELPKEAALNEIIALGAQVLPKGIHMLILSRNEPPTAFAKIRANKMMSVIGKESLLFSEKETSKLAKVGQIKTTPDRIKLIQNKTQGWAAGIVLLLEQEDGREYEDYSQISPDPTIIFDYFAYEIFQKRDKREQDILIKSALLPIITREGLYELTGEENACLLLERQSRNNYFIYERKQGSGEYQYHDLFLEFLLTRVEKSFEPDELLILKKKAAALMERLGYLDEAIETHIENGDWEELTRILSLNAQSILERGRGQSLGQWLQSFPETILEKNPWLLYWLARSLQPCDLSKSSKYFNKAYCLFRDSCNVSDRDGLFLSWAGIAENIQYERSDSQQLDGLLADIEEIVEKDHSFPSKNIEAPMSFAVYSALLYRQPGNPILKRWEQELTVSGMKAEDVNLRALSTFILCFGKMWMGECAEAGSLANTLRSLRGYEGVSPIVVTTLHSTEAMYHWLTRCNPDEALRSVAEGLKLSQKSGVYAWYHHTQVHGAAAALSKGDVDLASSFLASIETDFATLSNVDMGYFHFLCAWRSLLAKDTTTATSHAYAFLDNVNACGVQIGISLARILLAEVMYECGNHAECENQLRLARELNGKIKSSLKSFMYLATETRLALKLGDESRAIDCLRDMFRLGREKGIINYFGCRHSVMASLCVLALKNNIETEYTLELIQIRGLVPEKAPQGLDNWPWRIRINALGQFSVFIDGKPSRYAGKAQKKPFELLKALISFGGINVSEDLLIEALWPDAEGDAGYNVIKATLHRLRKLLVYENAVLLRDGKLSLDDRYCSVDVWSFEVALLELEEALGQKDQDTSLDEMSKGIERVIQIYKGSFLGEEKGHVWAMNMREKLRSKYFRLLSQVADFLINSCDPRKAVDMYLAALEIEPLAEEVYKRLMGFYEKEGMRGEAVSLYNRYQETLIKPLGVEPLPEIEGAYRRIVTNT